jgi:glycosyltransferase involved in cell wall biosynthesis
MRRHATHLFAIASDAGRGLFGPDIEGHPKYRPMVTAVDLEPFNAQVDSAEVRAQWDIAPNAPVMGHVARFSPYKNHRFLIDIASVLREALPDLRLLLVGDGPERSEVEKQVAEHGLQDAVTFTGFQPDVPALMRAMDLFVFPSKWEGLGRVVVEAQAAGLPCLISDAVQPEAEVVPELIRRMPLSAGAEVWAKAAHELLQRKPEVSQSVALARVQASEFSMDESARIIADIYRGAKSTLH